MLMDFCVRCGKKDIFQDFLCSSCYKHLHPAEVQKVKKKAVEKIRHESYYEASIQLRHVTKAVIDYVIKEIDANGIVVSSEVQLENGMDFNVDNKKFAQQLGKQLQGKFSGAVKLSASIFSRDRMTGREIHRVTMLFKQFPLNVGDTFSYKGEEYKILSLGYKLIAQDETKKRRTMTFRELERARIF